jgi:acyl-CoA thioester hydrolase
LEAARVEFWRSGGLDYRKFEEETGLGLPVVEAKQRYRIAARFDDLLRIETWVSEASRASVWYDSKIFRGENVIHESSIRLACVSFAEQALRKIPDSILDASLEKGWDV